jgi:predicted dehydrogenase
MTAPGRLRGVLIGCGHISRSHLPGWAASPDAEIVAVCDLDRARAEARAAEFGIGRAYVDPAAALAAERPDVVDIATRPEAHSALIELAAARGAHVLCQKPLAPTLTEAEAMAVVCRRAGVRFAVLEMWRWLPWYREIARRLASGEVGPVHYARWQGGREVFRRRRPVVDDQPYFADMPKLLVYEMAIHWIDTARYLFGEVASVYARTARINPALAGEDMALVALTHAGGATTLLDASWASPPERREAGRRDGNLLVEGRDGSYRFDDGPGVLARLALDGDEEVIGRYKEAGDPFLAGFAGCIGHVAACLRTGEPFESPIEDNLKTLAATLAAYDSAQANRVITLPA